jgi:hypothetical protein
MTSGVWSAFSAATGEQQDESDTARWFYSVVPLLFLTLFIYVGWSWLSRRVRNLLQIQEERALRQEQQAARLEEKMDRIIEALRSNDKRDT